MNQQATTVGGTAIGLEADAKLLIESGLLDADWYREAYPDVDIAGMNPALHYLKYGALLDRNPGPDFDTALYYDLHPSVRDSARNPLVHYLDTRQRTGRPPEPDPDYVLRAAARLLDRGEAARAMEVAETLTPERHAHAVSALRANLAHADEAAWLDHLNRYLAHFGMAPVLLAPEGADRFHRLSCAPLPPVARGPLVTVIMPAWNAEDTIVHAAHSVLGQTWRPLELIIVDDASSDGTWARMQEIAASDDRVKIIRNRANVGPYVSKNLALAHATGRFVTGHDADDWAHPQRLERHVGAVLPTGGYIEASLTYMIRMRADGWFSHFEAATPFSPDGVTRQSSISCLFEMRLLREDLGHWDCVRFGGDTEMISRAQKVLGGRFAFLDQIGMICLDGAHNLTNDPVHGIRPGPGGVPTRRIYRDNWRAWHKTLAPGRAWLDFPQAQRQFAIPEAAAVPAASVIANLRDDLPPLEYARPDTAPPPRARRPGPTATLPVADIAAKLWGGFSTPARADLRRAAEDRTRSASDRAEAAWNLARWEAAGDDWAACARHIEALGRSGTDLGSQRKVRLLHHEALIRLGRHHEVVRSLRSSKDLGRNANYRLSYMNAVRAGRRDPQAQAEADLQRLGILNDIYRSNGLAEVSLKDPRAGLHFGNIAASAPPAAEAGLPKISVLMPVHNAEEFLETVVEALLAQSWRNLEVVAVDDASTDAAWEILTRLAAGDDRLRAFRNDENSGAYPTRNRALSLATGEIVTIHDSDDWSHPQMLEWQARALMADAGVKATFTAGARVSSDLEMFLRPERDGLEYISRYYPSVMMRRRDLDRLGRWDGVRASADDEFVERARALFGRENMPDVLPNVPFTFLRRHDQSLTHAKGTHLRSMYFGIRGEYARQAAYWRARNLPDGPGADFPLERTDSKHPFPIPAGLTPGAQARTADYDLVIVSDLTLLGGTRRCNEGYITAATALGYRVGLFHWPRYDLRLLPDIAEDYRALSYRPDIDILVPEDRLRCRTVIVHHPPILNHRIDAMPRIETDQVLILANQSPKQTWRGTPAYYFPHHARQLSREFFDCDPVWAPISPTIRRILTELGGYDALTDDDWIPPLGYHLPQDGPQPRPGAGADRPIVIGRHARDHWSKWPSAAPDAAAAYCADTDISARFLGGTQYVEKMLRRLPRNWEVSEFDTQPVQDFIASLDFFVNFINEESVEAFGRNIMEAMAHGVPTVLQPIFRETFGDAAVYCAPGEVEATIRRIWADPARYNEISRKGYAFVRDNCDQSVIEERLARLRA